jgi:hypothetical protein
MDYRSWDAEVDSARWNMISRLQIQSETMVAGFKRLGFEVFFNLVFGVVRLYEYGHVLHARGYIT